MNPTTLRERLVGLLSFPVTPFDSAGGVDIPRFQRHVEHQLSTGAKGLFVGCGTGEGFSLDLDEHRRVVAAAVEVAGGKRPVIAGVGYGYRLAIEMAQAADVAGADGLLALPPYLIGASQKGLHDYYRDIAQSVDIGVIVYQRGKTVLQPPTVRALGEIPNVIGLKDGIGNLEALAMIRTECGGSISLMNGMPTAELTAAAFRAIGVTSYSSAVLNFAPEIAMAFYQAITDDNVKVTDELLRGFFMPFARLRDEQPGYAVSLVKAGINIRSESVGDPRPPLLRPEESHLKRLETLIAGGLELV